MYLSFGVRCLSCLPACSFVAKARKESGEGPTPQVTPVISTLMVVSKTMPDCEGLASGNGVSVWQLVAAMIRCPSLSSKMQGFLFYNERQAFLNRLVFRKEGTVLLLKSPESLQVFSQEVLPQEWLIKLCLL